MSDRRAFNFRLDFGERNFNHVNEFVSRAEQHREKDEMSMKPIKGFYSVHFEY